MAWLQIVFLIVEVIKLILRLRDGGERVSLFAELGTTVEEAVALKDRLPLKQFRDRVKSRCKECGV